MPQLSMFEELRALVAVAMAIAVVLAVAHWLDRRFGSLDKMHPAIGVLTLLALVLGCVRLAEAIFEAVP